MSQLGIKAALFMLFGDETTPIVMHSAWGKTISRLELKDDKLHFEFSDQTKICVFDAGQSCCEYRYMTTDDDLRDYIGSSLVDMEISDGPTTECDGGTYEIQFLRVFTSKGIFVCETHNEHNGYYGGFCVVARVATSGTRDEASV